MRTSQKIVGGFVLMLLVSGAAMLLNIISQFGFKGDISTLMTAADMREASAEIYAHFEQADLSLQLYQQTADTRFSTNAQRNLQELEEHIEEALAHSNLDVKSRAVLQNLRELETKYMADAHTLNQKIAQQTQLVTQKLNAPAAEINTQLAQLMDRSTLSGKTDIALAVATVRANFLYANIEAQKYLNTLNQADALAFIQAMASFNESADILDAYLENPASVETFATIRQLAGEYAAAFTGIKDLSQEIHTIQQRIMQTVGPEMESQTAAFSKEAAGKEQQARSNLLGGLSKGIAFGIGSIVVSLAIALAAAVYGMKTMNSLGRNLSVQFQQMLDALSRMGTECGKLAENMVNVAANIEQTSRQSSEISSQSGTMTTNISEVSSAIEEMDGSIQEIGHTTATSQQLMAKTSTNARTTFQVVEHLSDSSTKIGEVVNIINALAEQTNLLALNASIEAARAGDAGRGFAVVAEEVKKLAAETAEATGHINEQVENIQTVSTQAVASIQSILTDIENVAANVNLINASVSEQQRASSNISQNMQQASGFIHGVGAGIQDIAGAAEASGQLSNATMVSSRQMADEVQQLVASADSFLQALRKL